MKHFGDITKIHGDKVPIVDIITGGSPCQDLSVAGKRAGLAGERSGLFMEQIRIVKEMRDESKRRLSIQGTDNNIRYIKPRYMVWENVAGAFSSGTPKGADFRAVLEEIIKIVVKEIPDIPIPEKGWSYAGCIEGMGDDNLPFSICWRLHDAQYWGVPQRRKRISLVADFGGLTAAEILFERKSVSRDIEESGEKGQGVATDTERSVDKAIGRLNGGNPGCNQGGMIVLEGNGQRESHKGDGYKESDVMYTLNTVEQHAVCIENHPADSRVKISDDGVVQTLSSRMGTGGGNVPMVMEQPITASKASFFMNTNNDGEAETLVATDYKDPQLVAYGLDRASFNQGQNAKYNFSIEEEKIGAQLAKGLGAVFNQSVVRRLTPLECERLQGFPDGWTDIGEWTDSKGKKRKCADAPRYKALGNSIALPFWEWMAERMVKVLKDDGIDTPTMASLFDGIGGFPLVYRRCGCKPVWASEIEEVPIAVTKYHFGED